MTIKDFVKSITIALGDVDLKTFELLDFFKFHHSFDKEWINRIEKVIDEINSNKISLQKIQSSINLSNFKFQFFLILLDLKSSGISKQRRMKIANFLHELLKLKAKNDTYGFKSNVEHSKDEIKKIMKKSFIKANEKTAKLLGGLFTSTFHLCNSLYSDFYTDYGAENLGQYKLSKNKILVIKKFNDLNPLEIWPESKHPYKSIIIYNIYENVEFTCDMISCHSKYKGNQIKGLKKFRLEVNGKIIERTEEIREIIKVLNEVNLKQWQRLNSLNKKDLKRKILFMRCYVFKGIFESVGIDWKPNIDMLKAIKKNSKTPWNPPKNNQEKYWEKVLDPEIEFYG